MPKQPPTVKIRVEWHGWNYGHGDGGPYWLKEDEEVYEARVTPERYIVHYGDGKVKKMLKRFLGRATRRGVKLDDPRKPRTQWLDYFGSHERLSYTKLIFTLLDEPSIGSKVTGTAG